jgi:hypothetical protein
MRTVLALPAIDYGNLDAFEFPPLSNRLADFPSHVVFNPWNSGYPPPYHGFVADFRIEAIWRDRYKSLGQMLDWSCPVAISPDFSVETDYPLAVAFWNVWRSRVIAASWQASGIYVVPCLQWSRPELHSILFAGLQDCEVVAVRSPTKGFEEAWEAAAKVFLSIYQPKLVLHFGTRSGFHVWGSLGRLMNLSNKK